MLLSRGEPQIKYRLYFYNSNIELTIDEAELHGMSTEYILVVYTWHFLAIYKHLSFLLIKVLLKILTLKLFQHSQ